MVFVHGAFCGGWAFDGFRAPFEAAGFETHAPNLPGHERGADLEVLAQTGVRDYAAALSEYVADLAAPPVLVGHSMGGLIVQLAAARTPVAALVLLAPSAPWGVMATTLDEHANAFGVSLLGDFRRRPVAPDFPVARRTTLDRMSREDARRAFARFVPESGRAIFETVQWWLDPNMNSAAPAFKISAPVLALAGGRDRVNPPGTVRRIATRFPDGKAQFHEFEAMSHWLVGEPEWPEVAQLTLDWLEAQGLKPSLERKPKRRAVRLSLLPWRAAAG